jgi:capsular polysaccharide biosynthesis protein
MYLVDALTVLIRRWYIVLAGILVLAGGAAFVVTNVPTTYQSSGQMLLLLPPQAGGAKTPVNPYLNLQTGLTTAASLVAGAASTKDVEREMKEAGFDAEYAIALVPGTGPLLTVTAKDSDRELATATRNEMMSWVDRELRRMQDEAGVPQAQYISATRSSVSPTAEALPGSKMRALAALGAVVGLITLGLTFGIDRLLLRRSARRAAAGATATRSAASGRDTRDEEVPLSGLEGGRDSGLVLDFHHKREPEASAQHHVDTSKHGPGEQPRRERPGR